MNVWDGGAFDLEDRLNRLKAIGYEGIERLEAVSADDAMHQAAIYRKMGMAFGTVRGPSPSVSIQWAAALGRAYVWTAVTGTDFDTFCRQVNIQVEACRRWGITAALHNHLGTPVESQDQLEEFLARCPACSLLLDTAHLAAAGGDPIATIHNHADRLVAVHLKDWITLHPEIGLENWTERGRFSELGAGNVGLDFKAIRQSLVKVGYDGWCYVEQDTHLQDPIKDLAKSRRVLRDAGF